MCPWKAQACETLPRSPAISKSTRGHWFAAPEVVMDQLGLRRRDFRFYWIPLMFQQALPWEYGIFYHDKESGEHFIRYKGGWTFKTCIYWRHTLNMENQKNNGSIYFRKWNKSKDNNWVIFLKHEFNCKIMNTCCRNGIYKTRQEQKASIYICPDNGLFVALPRSIKCVPRVKSFSFLQANTCKPNNNKKVI